MGSQPTRLGMGRRDDLLVRADLLVPQRDVLLRLPQLAQGCDRGALHHNHHRTGGHNINEYILYINDVDSDDDSVVVAHNGRGVIDDDERAQLIDEFIAAAGYVWAGDDSDDEPDDGIDAIIDAVAYVGRAIRAIVTSYGHRPPSDEVK